MARLFEKGPPMSVLVTTADGYFIFTSSGKQLRSLEGHRVDCFTPGPAGTFLAVIDRHEVWSHGSDGEWTPRAKSESTLTAVVAADDAVFAGTDDARVLLLEPSGALEPRAGFDRVAGRDEWHTPVGTVAVRTMTSTADGAVVLANVHVGGIPRSTDGGDTWQPTIAVDDDVHQVLAHPSRPEIVVAAASAGLCRSADAGATWTSTTEGMDLTYARGVAIVGDDVVISVSDGPRANTAALYRAPVEDGPVQRVTGGLGELHGNVDSRCVASDGKVIALADGNGDVWCSTAGFEGFERIAAGLAGVTGVTVA
jgi:photosystem II stability/assembly factor-like uncharacterized protein